MLIQAQPSNKTPTTGKSLECEIARRRVRERRKMRFSVFNEFCKNPCCRWDLEGSEYWTRHYLYWSSPIKSASHTGIGLTLQKVSLLASSRLQQMSRQVSVTQRQAVGGDILLNRCIRSAIRDPNTRDILRELGDAYNLPFKEWKREHCGVAQKGIHGCKRISFVQSGWSKTSYSCKPGRLLSKEILATYGNISVYTAVLFALGNISGKTTVSALDSMSDLRSWTNSYHRLKFEVRNAGAAKSAVLHYRTCNQRKSIQSNPPSVFHPVVLCSKVVHRPRLLRSC